MCHLFLNSIVCGFISFTEQKKKQQHLFPFCFVSIFAFYPLHEVIKCYKKAQEGRRVSSETEANLDFVIVLLFSF